jgi:hypothetical protein
MTAPFGLAPTSEHPISPDPPVEEAIEDMSVAPTPDERKEAQRELPIGA